MSAPSSENTTARFDKLETLRKAAWESISARRQYEWRISIAFWTLLAAFIAGAATKHIAVPSCAKFTLWIFPLLLGIAHSVWLFGLLRAYEHDKLEEEELRQAMKGDVPHQDSERLIQRRKEIKSSFRYWNFFSQLMTTLALTGLSIFVTLMAL